MRIVEEGKDYYLIEEPLVDVVIGNSPWISSQDLATGEAWIELTPQQKIDLCHLAGAPFSSDPTHVLHEGQRDILGREEREVVWICGSRSGKAECLRTLTLTPKGWRAFGDLEIGAALYTDSGEVTYVTGRSPVYNEKTLIVKFDTGEELTVHPNHEWIVQVGKSKDEERTPLVMETKEMLGSLIAGNGVHNFAIPVAGPLEFPKQELLIPPYLLGLWLGDVSHTSNTISLAKKDIQTAREIERLGYELSLVEVPNSNSVIIRIKNFVSKLKQLGVYGNKHLPKQYLFSCYEQRLELLRGLMDTDGTISKDGSCTFYNTNKDIADGVAFLARSLGTKVWKGSREPKINGNRISPRTGKTYKTCYKVTFVTTLPVFRLQRKLDRIPQDIRSNANYHYIVDIKEGPVTPTGCIEVSSPSHLYLSGEALIPTHNSTIGGLIAFVYSCIPGCRIAIIAPSYEHAVAEYDYFHKAFSRVFGADATIAFKYIHHGHQYELNTETIWGSVVQSFSVGNNDLDTYMGKEFDVTIAGEGSKIDPETIGTKVWRALFGRTKVNSLGYARKQGRLYALTTADGLFGYTAHRVDDLNKRTQNKPELFRIGGEFYDTVDKVHRTIDWANSVYYRTDSVLINPAYSVRDFEAAKSKLGSNSPEFREQFLGEMVQRSGMVFDKFDDKKHVATMPSQEELRRMTFGIGFDFGNYFAAVLVGMDREKNFWVINSLYSVGNVHSVDIRDTREMLASTLGGLIGLEGFDEHAVGEHWPRIRELLTYTRMDHSWQSKEDTSNMFGLAINWEKMALEFSLNSVNTLFAEDRLRIVSHNYDLIEEIKKLTWRFKKYGQEDNMEKTIGHKHAIDGLRYVLIPMMKGEVTEEIKTLSFEEAYMQGVTETAKKQAEKNSTQGQNWWEYD